MYESCKYVALGRTYESAPTHVVYAAVLQHFFNNPEWIVCADIAR